MINSRARSPIMNTITTVDINIIARIRTKKAIPPANFLESFWVDIKYETKIGVQEARQTPTLLNIPNENAAIRLLSIIFN